MCFYLFLYIIIIFFNLNHLIYIEQKLSMLILNKDEGALYTQTLCSFMKKLHLDGLCKTRE
jgi:hypothetical protein